MRIVFILNSSGLYGANRSLLGLIQFLIDNNHKCFVIIPTQGGVEEELQKLGIEYKIEEYRSCMWYPGYIGAPFLVNLINLPKIVRDIKKWDVDIIHSNSSSHDIGIIISKILRKKHVWHIREIMESNYRTRTIFPKLYKWLRAKSDAVICVSKFIFDYHMKHYPNTNMQMIYNPYDIDYYNISRKQFATDDRITILMAGNMTPYKRQIDSVKAVGLLVEEGIENIELILAGNGEEECVREITNYINEKHLEEWIRRIDFVKDLREIRRNSDIILCCSVDEALPRVIVEGMLGELLAIGADSGGIAELIEHKKRGLLYKVGDYKDLAEQIKYAIDNKEECYNMIKEAKEYAVENFELKHSGNNVVDVYTQILR